MGQARSALRRRRQRDGPKSGLRRDSAARQSGLAYLVTKLDRQGPLDRLIRRGQARSGVIDIITHENAEKLKDAKLFHMAGICLYPVFREYDQPLKSADMPRMARSRGRARRDLRGQRAMGAHRVKVMNLRRADQRPRSTPRNHLGERQGPARPARTNRRSRFARSVRLRPRSSYGPVLCRSGADHNPLELFANRVLGGAG